MEYRILQDYIFRQIALECGRLGMAVHIHTGEGAGGYYDNAGGNPSLLEPLFNDPALRKTNFRDGAWRLALFRAIDPAAGEAERVRGYFRFKGWSCRRPRSRASCGRGSR